MTAGAVGLRSWEEELMLLLLTRPKRAIFREVPLISFFPLWSLTHLLLHSSSMASSCVNHFNSDHQENPSSSKLNSNCSSLLLQASCLGDALRLKPCAQRFIFPIPKIVFPHRPHLAEQCNSETCNSFAHPLGKRRGEKEKKIVKTNV